MINNAYGRIITNGLGGPAFCSIITFQFSLFTCSMQPIPPSPSIPFQSGGGPYPTTRGKMFYTPMPGKYGKELRIVNIKAKIGDYEWTKDYMVNKERANLIINIITTINKTTGPFTAVIDDIRKSVKNILVTMKDK